MALQSHRFIHKCCMAKVSRQHQTVVQCFWNTAWLKALHCFLTGFADYFYSLCSHGALEGHIKHQQTVHFFFSPNRRKKLLTFILSTDDQSVCQWARIMHNQIQSCRGNKVNPLYDPASIWVPVLVIGLLCVLHRELIQPGLLLHINTDFKQSLETHVGSGFTTFFLQSSRGS